MSMFKIYDISYLLFNRIAERAYKLLIKPIIALLKKCNSDVIGSLLFQVWTMEEHNKLIKKEEGFCKDGVYKMLRLFSDNSNDKDLVFTVEKDEYLYFDKVFKVCCLNVNGEGKDWESNSKTVRELNPSYVKDLGYPLTDIDLKIIEGLTAAMKYKLELQGVEALVEKMVNDWETDILDPSGAEYLYPIDIYTMQDSLIINEYFTILIYLLFMILLSCVILGFSYLFVVQNPETEKMSAYECGFEPYEDARQKFDVKFYIVAMLFIIFDIETMYLIPWCVALPYINSVGYFVMMEFILELCVGFLYVWYIGGLEWD